MADINLRYGMVTAPGTVRFERWLPGPITRIWEYLTDSEKRGKWLATGEMELFVGGKVKLDFLHKDLSPIKASPPVQYKHMEGGHSFIGKILKIAPPNLLSFTWEDNSEVTLELQEVESRVLLTLTHVKLPEDVSTRSSVAAGWHTHLQILLDHLHSHMSDSFWNIYVKMKDDYLKILSQRDSE